MKMEMVGNVMKRKAEAEIGKNKNIKNKKNTVIRCYDFNLAFLILFACAIGLIIVYSSSAYIAKSKNLESAYFLKRQMMTIGIGVVCMFVFSLVNYKIFRIRFKFPLPRFIRETIGIDSFVLSVPGIALFFMTILQGYTSFFADINNGAKRWITVMGVPLQPSELAKFVVIIFGAYTCAKKSRNKSTILKFFLDIFLVLPLIFLIAKENLSAALIVAAIYGAIIFTNSKRLSPYIILAGTTYFLVRMFVKLKGGYRSVRFEIWENVEESEKGQQILQGLYAIASGGIFGKGLGGSEQKYGRVPEAYNDMIFTIICEEFGIFGGIAIILIFGLILYRMWIVIKNARDRYGALLGIGIMAQVGVQVVLNVLVVTNQIPSTGVILPFISFGGTAIIIMLAEIGVFLNISLKIRYYDKLSAKNALKQGDKSVLK